MGSSGSIVCTKASVPQTTTSRQQIASGSSDLSPFTLEQRFEGLLLPVVAAPTFAIRKPAIAVFTLDDYVSAGIISATQATALRTAVPERLNIVVAGGTSTGKTTLTNALLAEVAKTEDRGVLIEDKPPSVPHTPKNPGIRKNSWHADAKVSKMGRGNSKRSFAVP